MTTVVFIAGSGHSGSTLLDLMLGSSPGFFSTGELSQYQSTYGLSDGAGPCTCGDRIRDCSFWESVRDGRDLTAAGGGYTAAELIARIADVSGCSHVVDSSKRPWRLDELVRSGQDLRTIHLVRDGRAVARSGDSRGTPYARLVVQWVRKQAETERAIRRSGAPSLTVRYEDLVRDPEAVLQRISVELLDGRLEHHAWSRFRTVAHHMLDGNRMRLSTDAKVSLDTRFLDDLSRTQWGVGSAAAALTLRTFGYPLARADYLNRV